MNGGLSHEGGSHRARTVAKSLLMEHLSVLPDPRKETNRKHQLIDILMITVCAVMAGAQGWDEIEKWGIESVPQARKGVVHEINLCGKSCTRDEGRPFKVGFQERALNHSKLLRSKAVVVNVGG